MLGGLLLDARLLLNSSKTELEYTYRRALNDLSDYVSGMRSTLKKGGLCKHPCAEGNCFGETAGAKRRR